MTVFVAVILAVLLGVLSLTKMSTDLLPSLELPYVAVITTYPGASPEKVEQSVTKPLEQTLSTAGGVVSIQSVSNENFSMIFMEFTQDTNMDSAMIEMNSQIDLIEGSFDEMVSAPMLMTIDPDMMPVVMSAVDVDGMQLADTTKYVTDSVIPELERISGVASVTMMGGIEKHVEVTFSDEKIAALAKKVEAAISAQFDELEAQITEALEELKALRAPGLMGQSAYNNPEYQIQEDQLNAQLAELQTQRAAAAGSVDFSKMINAEMLNGILTANNFSMPAGYIRSGEEQYLIKVGEAFASVEEISALELFTPEFPGMKPVMLSDVADIEMLDNSGENYTKINGNDGIILTVQKQSTASTADVCHEINDVIERLCEENTAMHITTFSDQGMYIDIVIDSVFDNLLIGAALAIIVLILFLRSARTTLVIAFSIPISLLVSLVLMYFSDISLNIISLAGLALAVGMLVDNSIVVIENIYRLRSEGVPAARAAMLGAQQVAGALVASTLTTVCVFLPIAFTDGISRQLFADMGLTIGFSLVASLLVALTLVPALASGMMKGVKQKDHKLFDAFLNAYAKFLNSCLRLKPIVLLTVVALLAFSVWGALRNGTSFIPEIDSGQMTISIEMPDGSSSKEARDMSDKVTALIKDVDGIDTIGAMQGDGSGLMMGGMSTSSNSTLISMYLILDEDRDSTANEIASEITELTKDLDCEISIQASAMDATAILGSGISVAFYGNSLDTLADLTSKTAEILRGINGTANVSDGMEDAALETRIIVNKNAAMKYSLTVAQIYAAVSAATTNETTSMTLSISSEDYDVIVVDASEKLVEYGKVGDYVVTAPDGTQVKLSDIAEIKETKGLQAIAHSDLGRTMSASCEIAEGYNIGLVADDVEEAMKELDIPDGYTMEILGESETIDESISDLLLTILVAIIFIYLIMVAQFQSLLSPFIVMFTIVLAITGGLLALVITGMEVSVISMLGFLILCGVIVNNGIVFVDYVNRLRLEGIEKRAALVLAGKTRMRPILMTAITTIFGLFTLALGIGQGAEMLQPLAVVAIGGLVYGTAMTLIVVPVLYDLLCRKEMKKIVVDEAPEVDEAISIIE